MAKFWVVLTLLSLTACSTFPVSKYTVSTDNVSRISAKETRFPGVSEVKVNIANEDDLRPTCRVAGPLDLPDGKNMATYIQSALEDELKSANKLSPKALHPLRVDIESLEGNSWESFWQIRGRFELGEQRGTLSSRYEFDVAFTPDEACTLLASNLYIAVQEFNREIFANLTKATAAAKTN